MHESLLLIATDEELIDYIMIGVDNAAEFARARGLDIPKPADPMIDQGPVPEGTPLHVIVTDDTPRSELPLEVLRDLIDEGDAAALEELHERYPGLYDDDGNLTPEAAAVQERTLASLEAEEAEEMTPERTGPPGP